MTLDELLTQLKALEAAGRIKYQKYVHVEFSLDDECWGLVELVVKYPGEDEPIRGWSFTSPAELETVLASARAEVGAR